MSYGVMYVARVSNLSGGRSAVRKSVHSRYDALCQAVDALRTADCDEKELAYILNTAIIELGDQEEGEVLGMSFSLRREFHCGV